MSLFDYTWFSKGAQTHPYRWHAASPGELLTAKHSHQLSQTFPESGYIRLDESNRREGKTYRNFSLPLSGNECGLSDVWQQFIKEVQSYRYRASVAQLLNQPIAQALELRFVKHASGDWLGPHTDGPDKRFSHIIYFNRHWESSWGGTFDVLHQACPSAITKRIIPYLGSSVILERADNSWHQVGHVAEGIQQARCSFLIHGLKGNIDAT